MKTHVFCLFVFASLTACGAKQEAIDEVQFGLTSTAAIGLASSLAMDAIKGPVPACATVQTACTTYPCATGSITISLSAGCPLPLGGAASGSVVVKGTWTTVDQATLSHTVTNTAVAAQGGKALAVASVKQVTATRAGTTTTLSFTGTDAAAGASGTAVAAGGSANWTLAINTKGTPDSSDDILTIDATSVAASGGLSTSAKVVKVKGVVLDPSCRANPVAGTAEITSVSAIFPTITKISFHSACDGKVEVDGSPTELQLLP